jgi:hypothetical protein
VLLLDARASGGFGAYLEELLGVEGVVGVQRVEPSASPSLLDGIAAAVLYGSEVPDPWLDALDAFATRGGSLVAVEAGPAFLTRFGIADAGMLPARRDGVTLPAADPRPLTLHVDARAWRPAAGTVEGSFSDGSSSTKSVCGNSLKATSRLLFATRCAVR